METTLYAVDDQLQETIADISGIKTYLIHWKIVKSLNMKSWQNKLLKKF